MLRDHCLQQCYSHSEELRLLQPAGEARSTSWPSRFTTSLREGFAYAEDFFETVKARINPRGMTMRQGTIVDAHFDRRPQLHQKQRRGCQKRFVTEAQCETALAGTFEPAG